LGKDPWYAALSGNSTALTYTRPQENGDEMTAIIDKLTLMSESPAGEADFENWLEMHDAFAFLYKNTHTDEFAVYASDRHSFVHTIAVPAMLLTPVNVEDLMGWNFSAYSSWGITIRASEPPDCWISPPLTLAALYSIRASD
jgi:hypothetical protein